jgi:glycosyltransferase involved in cell wall biosynthesis
MNDEHLADYLPGRFSLAPKGLTGFLLDRTVYRGDTVRSLQLRHSVCTSGLLKMRLLGYGAPVGHAAVIHQGVPCDRYRPGPEPGSLQDPPRILCVSGLAPSGGVRAVVRALVLLQRRHLDPVVTLAGPGDPAYVAGLKQLVAAAGLTDRVAFTGRISRDELARLYAAHDLFVFPSMHAEPAGLLHLEAMASGLPVVSTLNGGQREFLRPDENCVCFPAGDGGALAQSLARLLTDASLRKRLVFAARTLVETSYNLDRYISELRDLLGRVTREYAACA